MFKPVVVVPMALLCLAVWLLFLDKPPVNDDLVFIEYARMLAFPPLATQPTDYLFHGMVLKDFVVFESSHPPLVPYLFKAATWLVGEKIWALHLVLAPLLPLALLALGDLIRRHTGQSPWWAATLLLGPICLPQATSLMTDFPLLSFFLLAWAAWERHLADGRLPWLILCLLSAIACLFTAYQGLALLPILLLRGWAERRFLRSLLLISFALVPFLLFLLLVYRHYAIFPFLTSPRAELSIRGEVLKGMRQVGDKGAALLLYAAGALFAPLIVWLARQPGRPARLMLWAALGWASFLTLCYGPGPHPLWMFFLFATGTLCLPMLVASLAKQRALDLPDGGRLAWWSLLLCFLAFQLLIAPFASPRYNMPLLAALLVLLLAGLPRLPSWVTAFSGLLSMALGLLVAWADLDHARAQDLSRLKLPAVPGPVHFLGEMGVKFSAEGLGMHYLHPQVENQVQWLLRGEGLDSAPISQELLDLCQPVWSRTVNSSLPLRVEDPSEGISLFLHLRGMLPFGPGRAPLVRYTLSRCFQPLLPAWDRPVWDRPAWSRPALNSPTPANPPPSLVPAGPILPGAPLTWEFQSERAPARLDLYFATYARKNSSTVQLELLALEGDLPPRSLAIFSLPASEIVDNAYRSFYLQGPGAAGGRYRVVLSSPDAVEDQAITLWINASHQQEYRLGDQVSTGMPGIRAFSAPTLANWPALSPAGDLPEK
jgi:hypothetical protein